MLQWNMMRAGLIAFLVPLSLVVGGCERSSGPTAPVPPPTPQAVAPTTEPTTRPVAFLTIDGMLTQFPRAMLRLREKDGVVDALLYSDDPQTALNDNYSGNSFYLPMTLDTITDAQAIGTARWVYKAINSDAVQTPSGIFLNGNKQQLQPIDVVISFDGAAPNITVTIAGRFLVVNTIKDQNMLVPTFAMVTGQLAASVPAK
jgi:hypothetical protein